MPELKEAPVAVQLAKKALEILAAEDTALAEEARKKLPGFALRLAAAGEEVTVEGLLESARAREIDRVPEPKQETKTYDEIVAEKIAKANEGKTWSVSLVKAVQAGDLNELNKLAAGRLTPKGVADARLILIAAQYGHLDIIRYFVEAYRVDIHAGSQYRSEVLVTAAHQGRLNVVKYFAEKDPEAVHEHLDLALMTAAGKGKLPVVKYLVEKCSADIRAGGANGDAFVHAVAGGQLNVLKYLASKWTLRANEWHMLFKNAATYGHLNIVKYIAEESTLHFSVEGSNHSREAICAEPLSLAAACGRLNVVKYFVKNLGVPIHGNNEAVLQSAINNGRMDMADYLTKAAGADVTKLPMEYRLMVQLYNTGKEKWRKVTHAEPAFWQANEEPLFYRPVTMKAVRDILAREMRNTPDYEIQLDMLAFHTAGLFGTEARVLQYLEKWGKATSNSPLHDIVSQIVLPPRKAAGTDMKSWGDAVLKCGPTMARLAAWADKVSVPVKSDDGRTWSMINTREEVAKVAYQNSAKNPELSRLCLEYFVPELAFEKARLVAEHPAKVKNIPDITIDGEKFDMPGATFRRLAADDLRGLFLGEMVNDCQSIGAQGEQCARHGFMSENGGFYVVEKEDKVLAQTWAWRGGNGELVFDSLEPLGNRVNDNQCLKLTQEFAKAVSRKPGDITAFHVGKAGRTPAMLGTVFKESAAPAWPREFHESFHRDSGSQLVVWQSKKYQAPAVRKVKITPVGE